MSFTEKFNLLKNFFKYSGFGFSICKIYQVLELKNLILGIKPLNLVQIIMMKV